MQYVLQFTAQLSACNIIISPVGGAINTFEKGCSSSSVPRLMRIIFKVIQIFFNKTSYTLIVVSLLPFLGIC